MAQNSLKKCKTVIKITHPKMDKPKMEKLIFLKSARTKTVDSHSIDSIGSIDCMDSIDSIESEDSTDSIDSIDFIDSIDSILVPHKRQPTFTPHTKGRALRARKQQYRWGRRLQRRLHRYCCCSLCVWCECWRSFVWHEYRI